MNPALRNAPSKKLKTEESSKMASAPEQFEGFMVHSSDKWNEFTKEKVGDPTQFAKRYLTARSSLPRSSRTTM
jgi:hypothetical protein